MPQPVSSAMAFCIADVTSARRCKVTVSVLDGNRKGGSTGAVVAFLVVFIAGYVRRLCGNISARCAPRILH